jgi:phospholipase/lecithinase/hemolysin
MFRNLYTALALTIVFAPSGAAHDEIRISSLLVFGDSLSDTGNLSLATEGAYASAPYAAGRASNGPLWVDHLAAALDVPRVAPALIGGTNHAWAGGETGQGVSDSGTPNLGLQVQMFLGSQSLTGDELIAIWAGANDVFQFSNTPKTAAQNVADNIVTLALAGGETFLVLSLDGIEQTPAIKGTAAELPTEIWVDDFRDALDDVIDDLEDDIERITGNEITIIEFDAGELFVDILDDPEDYGLSNVTDPACPGCNTGLPDPSASRTVVAHPDEYAFWDLVHPTRVVHRIIGDEAAEIVRDELDIEDGDEEEEDDDD